MKVMLVRSLIGTSPKQRKTAQAMGFRKREQIVELPDNACTRGMVKQIEHLVKVVE